MPSTPPFDPTDFPSIQRFLKSRGAEMIGRGMNRKAGQIQVGIGAALLVAGTALAAVSLSTGPSGLLMASIGPASAGIINLGIGAIQLRMAKDGPLAPLTQEARTMLVFLTRAFLPRPASEVFRVGQPGAGVKVSLNSGRSITALNDLYLPKTEALILFEEAVGSYHRIQATLASEPDHPSLSRLAARTLAASEEALVDCLHHLYTIAKFPEATENVLPKIERSVQSLGMLSKRIEEIAFDPSSFAPTSPIRSGVDDVLAELDLERMARVEIQTRSPKDINEPSQIRT